MEGGLLTEDQLRNAIIEHKKTDLKLGQYLVRTGIVREAQVVDLISKQLKIPKYSPGQYPIDMSLVNLIPPESSRTYQAVPMRKTGNLLTMAMSDPLDINNYDAIELLTNCEVEAIICTEQEINQLIGSLYGTYSELGDVLDDMDNTGEVEYASGDDDLKGSGPDDDVEVRSLQDMAEEAPVIRLVNSILSQAVQNGASDVHLSPEKDYIQVRFRVDGKLHEVPAPPKALFLSVASRLKILANMDISVSRKPQDGRFTLKSGKKEINIRASTIPTIYGENIVLRLLDTSAGVYSLEYLGMNETDREKLASVINKPYGMILSTGPTGSGKTTSLYAILKEIVRDDINIITLEDPVEYRMRNVRQVQLNPKAGMNFANGLRAIVRQDPDVIMVGETRDSETAAVSVQAALTGHRVLSTIHTNDAAGAITRLLDMGIEPFLISSVILVSIAQRLVRKICSNCWESYRPSEAALKYWNLDNMQNIDFIRGRGCFNCMDTGFKGRTGIYEVLVIDEIVQDMILARESAQKISRAAKNAGNFSTLKDNAAEKVISGITTLTEAASAVMI